MNPEPETQNSERFIVTYRGWPLFFENDPYRQCFRIVGREEASRFRTRENARATARAYNTTPNLFAIEPLNP